MKDLTLLILLVIICIYANAQQFSINGFVQDAKTGERLAGATVYCAETGKGTTSNSYGYFSLSLKDTSGIIISVRFMGYELYEKAQHYSENIIVIELDPLIKQIDEITITSKNTSLAGSRNSHIDIPLESIKTIPVLLGERDLMKSLLTMPGVQFASEGSANISIRGGSPDQNLILVDDVPVYNSNHLLGIFSIFNTDALKNATVLKGSFPARYGGRTSSVIDLRLKDGNMKEFKGNVSLGLITSRLMLEGPIVEDRISFLFTARRTFLDLFTGSFMRLSAIGNDNKRVMSYKFYDMTGKINYIISDTDRIYLSYFSSKDPLSIENKSISYKDNGFIEEHNKWNMSFGNRVASIRWNHIYNSGIFSNATFYSNNYYFLNSESYDKKSSLDEKGSSEEYYLGFKTGIFDLGAKVDFDMSIMNTNSIRVGGEFVYHRFNPGVEVYSFSDVIATYNIDSTGIQDKYNSYESIFYIEDEFELKDFLSVNIGYRLNVYTTKGKTYINHDPRISCKLAFTPQIALEASYSGIAQNLHLLSNTGISLPTDLWVPVTKQIEPILSVQQSIGINYLSKNRKYEIKIEAYNKTLENLIEYKEGASFIDTTSNWENKVEIGRGESYGVELMAEKKTGLLQGWISYTLSKSTRTFTNINFGRSFPYKFDRPHNFSITSIFNLKNNRQININWYYATGNPLTFAFERYRTNLWEHKELFRTTIPLNEFDNYSQRNNFRLPDYHRLDIGYTKTNNKEWGKTEWGFSIYNLYNRHNTFLLLVEDNKLMSMSLLPIIPSVQFSIYF